MRFQRLSVFLLLALLLIPVAASAVPAWSPLGPFGGGVSSITADPSTPGVLYAATNLGLYKTADAGGSWTALYTGPLADGRVAVDPLHPATLYLTGIYQNTVVLKSVDGGAHWSPAGGGLPVHASILAVDPARPRRLYLGQLGEGMWRSLDAGASWQPAGDGLQEPSYIQAIAPASRPAGRVFIATDRGLYRSNDGGGSWSRAGGGLPDGNATAAAFAPSDPRTAYAYLESGGLYRSTDGGASWRRILKARPRVALEISVSAKSTRTVYVRFADYTLFRSTDGGNHWTQLQAPVASAVAADPFFAGTVYSSLHTGPNFGGVWRSGNQGKTWTQQSRGMTGIVATSLAIDRDDPDRLWITGPFPTFRTSNGGASWVQARMPAGEDYVLRLEADSASRIFALTSNSTLPGVPRSLWRTDDDGESWTRLARSPEVLTFRLAPSDPDAVYAVEVSPPIASLPLQVLLRSTDGGAHWENGGPEAITVSCGFGDLAVAPSNATVVYLGGCKDAHASAVLRSGDGGVTFTDVSAGLPGANVPALAVDPRSPDTVWAGTADGAWKSTNGGTSWTRAGAELAGLTIVALLAPDVPGRVYAATLDDRIFRSEDGGASWDDWTGGLLSSKIVSLQAAPGDPRRVYAVTQQGIWRIDETD
jgi:photosystem II stability/assembly factor-like uncharacterized protein